MDSYNYSPYADENMMSRDLGDLEDFDSFAEPCIHNDDDATYRGLAFEVEWFDGGGQGFDMPKQTAVATQPQTKAAPKMTLTNVEHAPVLTDAAGFVASQRLFCRMGADVKDIKNAFVAVCEARDCVREPSEEEECAGISCGKRKRESQAEPLRFAHFSRAHFRIAFEVRVWSIADRSCCMNVLRDRPEEAGYVVEFQKVEGCSSRWVDLFSSIAASLLDARGSQFFGRRPSPAPSLNHLALDDDDEDDEYDASEGLDCMMRMLSEGTLESQHAAVQSVVQYAVTKQACDQLVESGFLEAALKIAGDRLSYADMVSSELTLLRCILLVVSSVVTLSGKLAVAQRGIDAFVTSIQDSNPNVFTREHAPLLEAF
jgi:hypothetical protein